MNSPPIPPANTNRLACGYLLQRHFFANEPDAEERAQDFVIDRDRQFIERDNCDEKKDRDDQENLPLWRRLKKPRERKCKRPGEQAADQYVARLRVFVSRHKSLSEAGGLACC